MGIIDLLWPLVLLQLRGQSLMCPGWKFYGWIAQTLKQLKEFSKEIRKKIPSRSFCPNVSRHRKEIIKKKYGTATLENGWYLMALSPFRQNFEKNRNSQKYHHSLKEHPTFTKIAKFGCEML